MREARFIGGVYSGITFPIPDGHDRLQVADWRRPARCYRLYHPATEHDEQRSQSLPRAAGRPRSNRRPRCLRRLAGPCRCGSHLDAVRGPRPMGLGSLVRWIHHRVHARFHPARRLVPVQPPATPKIAHLTAAIHERLVVADMRPRHRRPGRTVGHRPASDCYAQHSRPPRPIDLRRRSPI